MPKSRPSSGDSALRSIPSVERLLSGDTFARSIREFGRDAVKDAVVAYLDTLRNERRRFDADVAGDEVLNALTAATASTLRRVINGSGIIIHTNLGRSPIDAELWSRAAAITTGYSNLEYDLDDGSRGRRDEHLTQLCRTLFGCEAAILTNNNAAGTLLLLAAVAGGREVIVSRGELVEIGGSFRVPDVIQQGGARLREVGTTNRTRAADYESAISDSSAAMLRVHRSNFEIVGFTESPSIEELVAISKTRGIPLLYDEGSGRVIDLAPYGFSAAPTIRQLIALGVDAITCSTDKLIGATQGGLILGSEEIINRCRKHPLMRALRAGKESYAIVAETLRAFATGRHEIEIPIYRMLATPLVELREHAAEMIAGTSCRVIESACALGGGTTPTETIPSIAIEVPGNASELATRFLQNDPPIVGRIVNDRFTIEMRTLMEADRQSVARAMSTYHL
ncbi:MAG: L-seryl-tRNA(Sec) selenium transferase [Acidobacteria bacterium]|nr:L-seryl-tRNA(Sec) selenium transferase [Acidobacteriota bacterium]MBV9186424.1 L-seryl-tRNA(Sec) selenium transferase [Acidobacteriota bacterium]